MSQFKPYQIPKSLQERKQWVMWRVESRDGKDTKVPFAIHGGPAKSNDPTTWGAFDAALDAYERGRYSGIGFMFSEDDPFCGIDLDGCRDPQSGAVSEWASAIIKQFDTYAEVSPSGTGVKLFCIGPNPLGGGRKAAVKTPGAGGKTAAIEVYDRLRYFAVTGYRGGKQVEPQERTEALAWLKQKYFAEVLPDFKADFHAPTSVIDRATKYLATMPPAISGQGGHNKCFHAACVLVLGFGLSQEEAFQAIQEWNARCEPPWSEKEIRHKLSQADKQPGDRNYLRNVTVPNQHRVAVPTYEAPPVPTSPPIRATLASGMKDFVAGLKRGDYGLISTGIPQLDAALSGGFEPGELIVIAGRPSHGKSAIALQFAHEWTAKGSACVIISEEMSKRRLGQRAIQFVTNLPRDQWDSATSDLEREIEQYAKNRAPCYIVEQCGTVENAISELEKSAADGAKFAIVDYAQLLRGPGGTSYERISNVCKMLKAAASRLKLTLIMLCQMSRSIESREVFLPRNTDLKESGQFEQDADVILFVVWPCRIDANKPKEEYMLFIGKNRNRDIRKFQVDCKFDAEHQRIAEQEAETPFTPMSTIEHDGYDF